MTEDWGPKLRLDTVPGEYVVVSDYRDHDRPATSTLQHQAQRPALDAVPGAHP
ncbi:hypothetical protein [Streptomyces mirabilis]|uniref:hypothetical protein n=1 Tax=Streptomyces mirabilis TaxID=68239 RepID=UPI0022C0375C|nr:hypothetical protein [Streptomyces mirabilis]